MKNYLQRSDAYLLQTATKKYFIRIGPIIDPNVIPIRYQRQKLNYSFPMIHISPETGFSAKICPTVSGGKWLRDINDIELCHMKAPVTKEQVLNFIFGPRLDYIICCSLGHYHDISIRDSRFSSSLKYLLSYHDTRLFKSIFIIIIMIYHLSFSSLNPMILSDKIDLTRILMVCE